MDRLFDAKTCERCHGDLGCVRLMSWFTEQTICMSCSAKESTIKKELRANGSQGAMEGCGYVPDPKKVLA